MNRFEGRLDRNHGVKLLDFRFNGRTYEIRTTIHSLNRFNDHGLDIDGALGSIVALGKDRLDKFALKNGEDTCIIDKIQHQAVIITFESEDNYTQIRIATIIPRDRVFVKSGTRVFTLREYKGGF